MSYTPINWQTGDTITAEKMNKMDNGWSVDSSSTVFLNETVTTEKDPSHPDDPAWGDFQYSEPITAGTVVITFNSVEYTCTAETTPFGDSVYGGLTSYPFEIISSGTFGNQISTENAGTYTVKIEGREKTVEISDNFSEVVNTCVDTSTLPMECVSSETTIQEMSNAANKGKLLFFHPYVGTKSTVCIITSFSSGSVSFIPERTGVSATFADGVFTVAVS